MKGKNFWLWLIITIALLLILFWQFQKNWFLIPFLKPPAVLNFSPYPLAKQNSMPDLSQISAKSFVVIDYDSGQVLLARNPNQRLLPASLTKMMTALIALESFSLDEWLSVENEYKIGKTMGLKPGGMIKVRDLIYGLLIHSANDAAWVLADNYNKKNSNNFIQRMNEKAKEIGLQQTNFVNFDGEDDEGHYSTALDLAKLTRIFLKNDFLANAVQIKNLTVYDSLNNAYFLETTNKLLEAGFEGVKTGWTDQARECFAGFFSQNGKKLITIVLGSQDRFHDTQNLLDQVMEHFFWIDYSERNSGETAST